MLYLGILSVIIGLLFFQWFGKNYLRPPFSKPLIFYSNTFKVTSIILQILLVLGGFFLIFRSSVIIGFILIGINIFIFLYNKRITSIKATKNAMYKAYYKVKKFYPVNNIDLSEKDRMDREKYILLLTLEPRYRYFGKYDMETLESIVDEYPDIESLTNFVILFEFYEDQYPGIDIGKLRKYVKDTFETIKEYDISLEDYIKNGGKYVWDKTTAYNSS